MSSSGFISPQGVTTNNESMSHNSLHVIIITAFNVIINAIAEMDNVVIGYRIIINL